MKKIRMISRFGRLHIILPITAAVLVGAVGTLLWKSSNALDGLSQPCVAYNFSISDRAKYPQCVSMAQHLLIQNGNLTNTAANYNGDFGPVTQSAIIAFQKTHFDNRGVRLVASGWLNAPTWWSLCDVAYDAGRTGTGWAYQQAGCNKPANWEVAFRTNINIVTATVPAPASSSAPAPSGWARPISGAHISLGYSVYYCYGGKCYYHNGIDLAAPFGTEVRSVAPGKVTCTGYSCGYGMTGERVVVDHGGGIVTVYDHVKPAVGIQNVAAGQRVGTLNKSGNMTGYHLHFSVFKNGVKQNPLSYIALP